MLRRVKKLVNEPAFREAPLTVTGRAISLALHVAFGRSPIAEITPGARLKLPADLRFTTTSVYLLRDSVEPEVRYLDKFVRPGDVFVDVGANIGLFTLKAATIASRVVAAEPGADAGLQLTQNLALNGFKNVTIVPKAISDTVGKAVLFHNPLGDDPQAFSLINDGTSTDSEEVEITTLDTLVADLGLTRVDCIKIDVEGAEDRVIGGAARTLETFRPTVIFEMNCPTLVKDGGDTAGAWKALAAHGYHFFQLEDNGALKPLSARPTDFGNYVALHPQGRVLGEGSTHRAA
ncbi:FkbM family methyltransferase [Xanthobacter dioxanivorans]|uniref:FkbM family methyltransferase n=1 Tax=Xanthobacter dioxanivorans TaxID=2528964 RepID=A0A974PQM8_9HYPH|nr:FkbM family methyltransferase [Xanthobacter dioxanivorans]QRG07711.1 FkbM family methyltransferase [Xanthobacter dioxanivorans]